MSCLNVYFWGRSEHDLGTISGIQILCDTIHARKTFYDNVLYLCSKGVCLFHLKCATLSQKYVQFIILYISSPLKSLLVSGNNNVITYNDVDSKRQKSLGR